MKKLLFIDRDGTIIKEPADEQIDSFSKLEFVEGVIRNLAFIRKNLDFEFVMVSNQDGLGTDSFPEDTFWPVHNFILQTLKGEGITFDNILIDRHFPEDNSPYRKPGTAMLKEYIDNSNLNPDCKNPIYDLSGSYVIGDRDSDAQFAKNLGCKALILSPLYSTMSPVNGGVSAIPSSTPLSCDMSQDMSWDKIAELLFAGERICEISRKTKETDITVRINLDGTGKADINTGLGFFDHMLEQIAKHGMTDLYIRCNGDLHVDEHHTIEDTGIVLGECLLKALGDKRGIERYGFNIPADSNIPPCGGLGGLYCLPMDDCLCQVALDFGGRPWLIWDAEFHREKVGEMPTEMFMHFFKSVSDASKMNLNIHAEGTNEHHKIEGIFKAFARSIRMAVHRDIYHYQLPSSKGVL